MTPLYDQQWRFQLKLIGGLGSIVKKNVDIDIIWSDPQWTLLAVQNQIKYVELNSDDLSKIFFKSHGNLNVDLILICLAMLNRDRQKKLSQIYLNKNLSHS